MDVTIVIPAKLTTEQDIIWLYEAVQSALAQTKKCDIIVVMNGCTYEGSIVLDDRVTIINSKEGLSRARNAGISKSTSEWFFPLDANDWLPPDAIETAWANRPDKGFVYGATLLFRGNRKTDDHHLYTAKEYDFSEIMKYVYFPSGALQRKEDWKLIGGYREDLPFLEDWDYWLTAGEKGICGKSIPNVLYWYRQHDGIVARNKNTAEWESVKNTIRTYHSNIYAGVYPMACCGSKKKATPTPSYVTTKRTAILPGAEGMVLIEYVGRNMGKMIFYGASTNTRYEAGGSKPQIYVDIKDAITGSKTSPGFLEMNVKGEALFKEVDVNA